MIIRTSPRFRKSYQRLPKRIKEKAKEKEFVFRENPFAPQLKTHKLSGKDKECWAFRITKSIRIKFIFLSEQEVLFLDIGPHPKIYK